MTPGLLQMEAVVKVAHMIRIAECKQDRNMFAPNVAIRMTFGQSPTAIVTVAENMKFYNKVRSLNKWHIVKTTILNF